MKEKEHKNEEVSSATAGISKAKKKKTNRRFIIIFGLLILVGLVVASYVYIRSLSHETTNDAQIKSNMIPIIPKVGGYIDSVYVNDNQHVKKGDTLFTIDTLDYKVGLAQAKAALAQAKSQLVVTEAGIGTSTANFIATQSQVSSALGSVGTAEIKLRRATQDFERYKNLYEERAITKQQFEIAQAAKEEAEKQVEILKHQKQASASQSRAAGNQTKITEKQVAVAKAQVKAAEALVKKAKLDLGYATLLAPFDGQLSAVDAKQGQFISPGQSLFYLVDDQTKWVVANFKETALTKMEPGQKVDITVDAFPKIKFKGKVEAISPASGARFSLLPPDNATGNFVKTVQRIPVKITMDHKDNKPEDLKKLRSGMNVEIDVHIK